MNIIKNNRATNRPCYKFDKSKLEKFSDYSIIQLESVLTMIKSISNNSELNIQHIEDRLMSLDEIELEQAVPHIVACIECEL